MNPRIVCLKQWVAQAIVDLGELPGGGEKDAEKGVYQFYAKLQEEFLKDIQSAVREVIAEIKQ